MSAPMPWAINREPDQVKEEGIVGRWFVTAGADGEVNNQGRIQEMVSDAGYYTVVLFSWMTGAPNGEHIVSFDDIVKFFVFTGRTAEEHEAFCDRVQKIGKPGYDVGKGPRA